MKIVICNLLYPPLGIGGAERSVESLAKGLVSKGHDVTVLSRGTKWIDRKETIDGVKVVRLGSNPGYRPNIYNKRTRIDDFWMKIFRRTNVNKQFLKYIKKIKPDIVNSNVIGSPQGLWKPLKKMRIPAVHTLRNHSLLCKNHMYRDGKTCIGHCGDCKATYDSRRKGTANVKHVVGISNYILDKHKELDYFEETETAKVVPNSYICDADKIKNKDNNIDVIKFGYLGRLHHPKGIELFIEAAKKLKDKNYEFHIGGTGNPEYEAQLRESAEGYEKIIFHGFVDTADFLNEMNVLIVPSLLREPFGRSYIEAMAHGVPSIGANHGGAADIIDDSTGWLFEPGSVDSLVETINSVESSKDKLPEYAKNCMKAAEKYHPEKIADEYLNIYKNIKIKPRGRKALFVVATPLQYINALEARNHLGLKHNRCYLSIGKSLKNPTSLDQTLKLAENDEWAKVHIQQGWPKRVDGSDLVKTIKSIIAARKFAKDTKKFLKKAGNIEMLFIGDYRAHVFRHYAYKLRKVEHWLLDDGSATHQIVRHRKGESTKKLFNKMFVEWDKKIKRLHYLGGMKYFVFPKLTFFSCYNFKAPEGDKYVKNNYNYFTSRFPDLKQKDEVWIIGMNHVENNFTSEEKYLEIMQRIRSYYGDKKIKYFTHRGESEEKLKLLEDYNFEIVQNDIPLEIYVGSNGEYPKEIASVASSVIDNLSEILKDKIKIKCFSFAEDYSSKGRMRHLRDIANYHYTHANVSLVED